VPGAVEPEPDGASMSVDTQRTRQRGRPGNRVGPGKHSKASSGWLRRWRAARAERPRRSLVRELPVLVLFALVIAMVIKTFVIQAFVIPSGSMQNTLAINDKILVNKFVYDFRAIKPGDIVVFNGDGSWNAPPPAGSNSNLLARLFDDTVRRALDSVGGLFGTPVDQTDYVKRVIGVPGDHVSCCTAQGLVTVNGMPLHEQSYLYPGDQPGSAPAGIAGHFSVTVPPGYLWVLGDHRGVSDDSRGHRPDPGNGMIPESKVIGRAFVIVWPPSHWRILPVPATFGQPGVGQPGFDRTAVPRSSGATPRQRPAIAATLIAATLPAATLPAGQPMARVRPAPPYLPMAAGVGGTVPLTWLERRARRWFRVRIRGRR
jgi:signal peptidase I